MLFLSESYKQRIKELAGIKSEAVYYNSHGVPMTFSDFIYTEVEDKDNYKIEEIDVWKDKYKIKDDDLVIWVTPNKRVAQTYMAPSYLFDELIDAPSDFDAEQIIKNEMGMDAQTEPIAFKSKDGFIIPESDDGDEGFLMVLTTSSLNEAIQFTATDLTGAYDKSWQRVVGYDIEMIKQAIREGRAIGVSYKSKEMPVTKFRVVLPVTVGVYDTKNGVPLKLSAFHLAGQSEREAQRTGVRSADPQYVWRLFDLDRKSFKGMWFSDKFFYEYPPGYKKGDRRFISIISEYDVKVAEIERDERDGRGEKDGEPIDLTGIKPQIQTPPDSPENIPEPQTPEEKEGEIPLSERERRALYLKKPWNKFLRDGFEFS